jgi:cob(I)alamin adenosyltransferase
MRYENREKVALLLSDINELEKAKTGLATCVLPAAPPEARAAFVAAATAQIDERLAAKLAELEPL